MDGPNDSTSDRGDQPAVSDAVAQAHDDLAHAMDRLGAAKQSVSTDSVGHERVRLDLAQIVVRSLQVIADNDGLDHPLVLQSAAVLPSHFGRNEAPVVDQVVLDTLFTHLMDADSAVAYLQSVTPDVASVVEIIERHEQDKPGAVLRKLESVVLEFDFARPDQLPELLAHPTFRKLVGAACAKVVESEELTAAGLLRRVAGDILSDAEQGDPDAIVEAIARHKGVTDVDLDNTLPLALAENYLQLAQRPKSALMMGKVMGELCYRAPWVLGEEDLLERVFSAYVNVDDLSTAANVDVVNAFLEGLLEGHVETLDILAFTDDALDAASRLLEDLVEDGHVDPALSLLRFLAPSTPQGEVDPAAIGCNLWGAAVALCLAQPSEFLLIEGKEQVAFDALRVTAYPDGSPRSAVDFVAELLIRDNWELNQIVELAKSALAVTSPLEMADALWTLTEANSGGLFPTPKRIAGSILIKLTHDELMGVADADILGMLEFVGVANAVVVAQELMIDNTASMFVGDEVQEIDVLSLEPSAIAFFHAMKVLHVPADPAMSIDAERQESLKALWDLGALTDPVTEGFLSSIHQPNTLLAGSIVSYAQQLGRIEEMLECGTSNDVFDFITPAYKKGLGMEIFYNSFNSGTLGDRQSLEGFALAFAGSVPDEGAALEPEHVRHLVQEARFLANQLGLTGGLGSGIRGPQGPRLLKALDAVLATDTHSDIEEMRAQFSRPWLVSLYSQL